MRFHGVLAVCLVPMLLAPAAAAQPSYEVVHTFKRGPIFPIGTPFEASNGLLYGITENGGTFDRGTVFTVPRKASGTLPITVIHSFSGPDGTFPIGVLVEIDGILYGTTRSGGVHGHGTVFRMSLTGVLTTLHSFNGHDGSEPGELMRARDGLLYGVTRARFLRPGILQQTGTLYKISVTGDFTELHQFSTSGVDLFGGAGPRGPLLQAPDGTFFGVTDSGGSDGPQGFAAGGTIFQLTEAGVFTQLHTFNSSSDYWAPTSNLIRTADGNIYGVAGARGVGSTTSPGAIFRMTPDRSVVFIHAFTEADGVGGRLLFQDTDGTIVGSLPRSVFRVTVSGARTTIRSFSTYEGMAIDGVIKTSDGRLFGFAVNGGVTSRGTVFAMTDTGTLTGLNPFITGDEPSEPVGPLVTGSDGSVFGLSCRGGWLNAGTVYKRSAAGVVTTLHSFFFLDGACPYALIRGSDGHLYGAAILGGLGGAGTIFRVSETGDFSLVHTFTGSMAYPYSLRQTRDGRLIGSTFYGGAGGGHAVFRMTTAGVVTQVHSFANGCLPQATVEGPDGSLYGTTRFCGENLAGTLFKITSDGVITTLNPLGHLIDGFLPGPPTLGGDGRLYGTTEDANSGPGTVISSDLAGNVTTLYRLTPADGDRPVWGLIEGHDGAFYGVTFGVQSLYDDADPNAGSVFRVSTSGSFTLLHSFVYATGSKPLGPLVQTPDGAIFGTTFRGGSGQQGVLFRITF
ncbi:MAG TPA: choice-of-anchor tandem repeat GloVer-containing protein [Vicinamibacterales bacterium]|nr:choice-of-anchor tandem repeat GloVer-containing protein [Vicinamibacterales bacterium]